MYRYQHDGLLYGPRQLDVACDPARTTSPLDGYLYAVDDIYTMWYGDAKYTWSHTPFQPFIAIQGGTETNAGNSVVGKIDSQVIGTQIGATYKTKYGSILGTFGFDYIPWKTDTITLPTGVSCSSTTNTISAKGNGLNYFLPNQVPDCLTQSNGQTQIYYGGWASAYTDNYATDPLYTTSISQGMVDRRAAGTSYKIAGQFTSTNNKFVFIASDAWYQYGNNISQTLPIYGSYSDLPTNEWTLDGRYYFSENKPNKLYKGLMHPLSLRTAHDSRHLLRVGRHVAGRHPALQIQPRPMIRF